MAQHHPFEGKIKVFTSKKRRTPTKSIQFKIESKMPEIGDTLIGQFESLNFTDEEKRDLTLKDRQCIFNYQNLKHTDLKHYSEKLIKELNKMDQEEIVIQASDGGAYICLVAILSGKISSDRTIYFELSTVPLSLFPKSLAKLKKPQEHVQLKFQWEAESWLRPFKSLVQCPSYMKLQEKRSTEEEYHLFAA